MLCKAAQATGKSPVEWEPETLPAASGMFKNQLQELAQRSCFNLPAYSCIREGPDHAPRFKATVNFNGEIFESPNFCTTLRQAEHAAAEVALNTLSKRGPSQLLAAKILDETGVCKNLLQETAQRVGVSLPVYNTIKGGPGHLPVFKCLVEVAGRVFAGEPAKTKKQAEKNAAMVAWSVIKQWTQPPSIMNSEDSTADEMDGRNNSGALTLYKREERNQITSQMQGTNRRYGGRSRVRVVNVRGKNRLSREGSPAGQFHYGGSSPASPSGEIGFEDGRFSYSGQTNICNTDSPRIMAGYQRSLSLFDGDSTALSEQDAFTQSRMNGGNVGRALPLSWHHQPQIPQQRLSRLSCQSHSDRIELRRPLMEELELFRERDDDWLSGGLGVVDNNTPRLQQQQQQQPQSGSSSDRGGSSIPRRAMFQSQSERFELKPSLLDEMYYNDEEEWWLRGELMQPVAILERARSAMHREQENGSVVYYDGSRGSLHGSTESVSHVSNDFGQIGSAYKSGYRDASNIPFSGFKETTKQQGPYPRCAGAKLSSSFASFQNVSSPQISYEDVERGSSYTDKNKSYSGDWSSSYSGNNFDIDRAASPYTNFSVDTPNRFFFNNDGAKSIFSGYTNSTRSRGINDDELGAAASSSAVWSRPANFWASNSTASSVAQSLGFRQPTSMAPPVKVRQMVAVCSPPPPRCPAVEPASSSISNVSTHPSIQPIDRPSSSSETSACQFISQLRISPY